MRTRNARLAGITFLLYIATTIADIVIFARASSGSGIAAELASIARHAPLMRLSIVFAMSKVLYALILAVTLYALTRDVDPDLALLALACRVVEGVVNVAPATERFGLLSIATAAPAATAGEVAVQHAQAAVLMNAAGWSGAVGATIFAVGSALFAYLLLRGRGIPAPLAWLGLIGSLLIVPLFFLDALQLVSGTLNWLASMPILLFELTFAVWLLIKGVRPQVKA
jgi:hypothetical protein